jgi:hypothetical protein
MKNLLCRILFFFGLSLSAASFSQSVIFLHHSTGQAVYFEGDVPGWIANYNAAHSKNYQVTERSFPNTPYPWNNYPYDYWNLWVNNACDNSDPDIACLSSLCTNYNVIIFKHCFPGADIMEDDGNPSVSSSYQTLANYKLQYRALRDVLDTYPDNKFIVWTLAPLHRLDTRVERAARARQFVDWVKNEWLTEDGKAHPNIYIFDFFGYVAESNPTPPNGQVNCLKYDYEISHTDFDSHPNILANQTVGPIFAQFIVNTIEEPEPVHVTSITIGGADGVSSILTDGGTLQLNADIAPENATNPIVSWSISNGTGQASISAAGLVTAIANGTVTVTAAATDGSGIFGTINITIENQQTPTSLSLSMQNEIQVTVNESAITIAAADDETINNIYLFTILGTPVIHRVSTTSACSVDISSLPSGIYILKLAGMHRIHSAKLYIP